MKNFKYVCIDNNNNKVCGELSNVSIVDATKHLLKQYKIVLSLTEIK